MYKAFSLNEEIKQEILSQWNDTGSEQGDVDKEQIIKSDTTIALSNPRYTDAIKNLTTEKFVSLIGVVEAERINTHKVLELKLNPSSNPEYKDEQEIGLTSAAKDIVGTILAVVQKGLIEADMDQVKIFGRGHDMKTLFKIVAEIAGEDNESSVKILKEGSWLVIRQVR